MGDYLLVIGDATNDQVKTISFEMLREGYKPQILRMPEESYDWTEFDLEDGCIFKTSNSKKQKIAVKPEEVVGVITSEAIWNNTGGPLHMDRSSFRNLRFWGTIRSNRTVEIMLTSVRPHKATPYP